MRSFTDEADEQPRHGLPSFLSLNFLCGCATGILQLAIPLYAISLRASTVQLGLIAGVSGVGRMLIIVPSGLLVDRFGARTLFLHSTVWCVVLVIAMSLVSSPWALMGIMFFQGMAQSVSFLSLQAGFLKRLPYLGQEHAGWQRGATQLGFFLVGPVAGGVLLRDGHFRATFFVVSAIFCASILTSLYRRFVGIREIADDAYSSDAGELGKLRALLADPLLLQVLVIECLGSAIFMIFRTFVAPVAIEVLHVTIATVSSIIIVQGMSTMACLFAGGYFLRRFSEAQILIAGSLLVALGMLLLTFSAELVSFGAGSVTYGFGAGLMGLCSLSKLSGVVGEKGKVAALFSLGISMGSTFGPVLGGFVGESLTLQSAFITPIAFIASVLLILVTRDVRSRRPAEAEAGSD